MQNTFVVISDLHSYSWPLAKVRDKYLDKYDKIYILGDATDRGEKNNGEGGIQLLFDIKNLSTSYAGRVKYIPGNHDYFLYGYMSTLLNEGQINDNNDFKMNIIYNGGSKTIDDIDHLFQYNKKKFIELYNWLGNLPLQAKHIYNGEVFCLAHAFFDEKLFQKDSDFSLKKYFYQSNSEDMDRALNVLWFRKKDNNYDRSSVTSGRNKVIIGHTPIQSRKDMNMDLMNAYGETVKVYCVDGGIAYSKNADTMFKFDSSKNVVQSTYKADYEDVSSYSSIGIERRIVSKVSELKEKLGTTSSEIINSFRTQIRQNYHESQKKEVTYTQNMNLESVILTFLKNTEYNFSFDNFRNDLRQNVTVTNVGFILKNKLPHTNLVGAIFGRGKNDFLLYNEMVSNIRNSFNYDCLPNELLTYFEQYVIKVAFDYILKVLISKHNSLSEVSDILSNYILTGDETYLTRDGNVRSIGCCIGSNNFKKYLDNWNCLKPTLHDGISIYYNSALKK